MAPGNGKPLQNLYLSELFYIKLKNVLKLSKNDYIIIKINMKTLIAFADLTYTEQGISSNAFPYAGAIVGSYAKKKFGNDIEIELFKYPQDFKNYLENNTPGIVCFTNYSWTLDISHEFSKKIKNKFPKTIIVFGGPN